MRRKWLVTLLAAGSLHAGTVDAAGTIAGTPIANQAEIMYEIGTETRAQSSNVSTFRVAEVLDINVLLQTPERLVSAGAADQPLYFTLSNIGNGAERLVLSPVHSLTGDQFDPQAPTPTLVLDTDGSGDLSASDTAYVPGVNDPQLLPDASIGVMLLSDIPGGVADGERGFVRLDAHTETASGTPGGIYPGLGDQGVDIVLGPSGGTGQSVGEYLVGQVSLLLTKSATVLDPSGGDRAVPGAEIVYTVQVVAEGTGPATEALFQDAIPNDTRYVSGSLRLNGAVLTDASDIDAGEFEAQASAIIVDLGTLAPGDAVQQVQFTVTIN